MTKRRADGMAALAERIESGEGGYPNLVSAAASLTGGQDGDDGRERAVRASKTVIRPHAAPGTD